MLWHLIPDNDHTRAAGPAGVATATVGILSAAVNHVEIIPCPTASSARVSDISSGDGADVRGTGISPLGSIII